MSNNQSNRFPALVTDDLTLKPINPARLKNYLLPLKGQAVILTIGKNSPRRSDTQNRYYWAVVVSMIADNSGYRGADELESVHETLKKMFLPSFGRLNIAKSTASLTTKEFSEYLETIRTWAARELNLYIPSPDETQEE